MLKPNMAGKAKKAVKRNIFLKTTACRSVSDFTSANTGCATCDVVPDTIVLAIVSHLNACEKFPTAFAV